MTFAADVRRWAAKANARQEAVARDFIARLGTDVIRQFARKRPVATGQMDMLTAQHAETQQKMADHMVRNLPQIRRDAGQAGWVSGS